MLNMTRMKKWMQAILLAVFLLVLLCASFGAADGGEQFYIRGLSLHALEEGKLGLRFTVLDSTGKGVKSEADQYQLVIENVPLIPEKDENARTGYIFIVDVSRLYADNDATATKAIQDVLGRLVNVTGDKDGILVLWTGEKIETSGSFISRVQASASVANEFAEKHKNGKKKDDALLYSAISQAVNLAENPPKEADYDYFHIVILSDGYNTQGNTGAASLSVIANNIRSTRPVAVSSVLFYNRAVTNANKLSLSTQNRQAIQDFVESVGGRNYVVDYHREAEISDQTQAIASSFAEEITGTLDIIADIHDVPAERVPHVTNVMIVKDRQTSSVQFEIPWNVVPKPDPSVNTGTPVVGFARYGDQNSENTRALQRFLGQKGWYTGIQDGNFNDATRDALVSFYELMHLMVPRIEGEIGITEDDWTNISGMDPFPTPTPKPPFAATGERESENVRRLQEFLKSYGYYNGAIDGNFYNATSIAYQAFCAANDRQITRLNGEVVVTESEWAYIQNIPQNEVVQPTPVPDVLPNTSPTPTPDPIHAIKFGDRDGDGEVLIAEIQNKLNALGYYSGLNLTIYPGVYDDAMRQVVEAFNKANRRADPTEGKELSRTDVIFILGGGDSYHISIGEKLSQWLTSETSIGTFAIKNYILLIVVAVLLIVLIILIVNALTPGSKSEAENGSGTKKTKKAEKPKKKAGSKAGPKEKEVTFTISYQGASREMVLNPEGPEVKQSGLIRIGRASRSGTGENDIELDASDISASRKHAELYFSGNDLMVRNLSEKMPIVINGQKTLEPSMNMEETVAGAMMGSSAERLNPGDTIKLGAHEITVKYERESMTSAAYDSEETAFLGNDINAPAENGSLDRPTETALGHDGFTDTQFEEYDR